MMRTHIFLIMALFFSFNNYCLSQNETTDNGCTTLACHGNLVAEEVVHTAVQDGCDKCHKANGGEHPAEGVKGFTLLADVPALCYTCHDPNNTKTNVHSPTAKGDCMACHTPHSSPKYFLLKENPSDKLCAKCHDMAMTQKKNQHSPVKQGKCYKCHDPHDSDNPKLLKKETNKLCIKCHKDFKKMFKSEDVIHTPVTEDCTKCHNPHSSDNDHLAKVTVPELCYTCHDPNNTKKNVHSPTAKGKCMSCHTPHSSPKYFLLKENPASLVCAKCHVLKIADKKVKHAPIEQGKCHKCHDPHDSNLDKLLKKKGSKLCTKCHKSIKKQLKQKTVHAPFAENCISCHDQIHGSDEDYLFSLTGKDLCLKCHNKKVTTKTGKLTNLKLLFEKSKFIHGAIEKDGCISCHNPHAADNPRLLTTPFPKGVYASGTKENFALCFKCHDAALFETETTTTATSFRDGDQNLHYLHINKEKGRSCVACHSPHAADNEKMIAKKVIFGNWEMPINFILLNNGGSCRPGCHAEKKYVR